MSVVEKRVFSLAAEQIAFIDAKVASGSFATQSDVVREGLQALQDRDSELETWLRREVASAYDAMVADPSRAVAAKLVFDDVRARHVTRIKASP